MATPAPPTRPPTKEHLIEWLHVLEAKNEKRLNALVIELCFTEHLFPALQTTIGVREPAFGWCSVMFDPITGSRFWFRTDVAQSGLLTTEQEFIRLLGPQGHRFFLVTVGVSAAATGKDPARRRPVTEIEVKEVVDGLRTCRTSFSEALNEDIAERIEKGLRKHSRNFESGTPTPFDKWIGLHSVVALTRLFACRVVLNFGLTNPVDTDAIAMGDDGNLAVVEFKRKDPAEGRWRTIAGTPQESISSARAIHALTQRWGPKTGRLIFSEERRQRSFSFAEKSCFGLDLSHFGVVLLCDQLGISYRYLVWDWTTDKEDKEVPPLQDLENVFGASMAPRRWPTLRLARIGPSSVSGITRTYGSDSGSYRSGVRVQVTFDNDDQLFKTVAPPPHVSE